MAFKSLYVIIYDFMTMLTVEILKNGGNQTVLMTIEFQRGEKKHSDISQNVFYVLPMKESHTVWNDFRLNK